VEQAIGCRRPFRSCVAAPILAASTILRANAFSRLGRRSDALNDFQSAIKLSKTDPICRAGAAWLYATSSDPRRRDYPGATPPVAFRQAPGINIKASPKPMSAAMIESTDKQGINDAMRVT
jgi:hypothetical protein